MLTHMCPEDEGVITVMAIDHVVRNWTFLLKPGSAIEETEYIFHNLCLLAKYQNICNLQEV